MQINKNKFEPKYVQPELDEEGRLIAAGSLKRGMKIKDQVHKDFVMRQPLAGDLFTAEQQAGVNTPLTFNGAVMAQTLVRVGSYEGPFTVGMISELKATDYNILRAAQVELDLLGEAD